MAEPIINPEEWEDLASDLGFGINYWVRELTDVESKMLRDLRLPERFTVAVMAIDPDNGEDDQLLLMTKRDYEWSLAKILLLMPNTDAAGYVRDAVAERDENGYLESSYLDAEVADVVAQLHLFGEVQYG